MANPIADFPTAVHTPTDVSANANKTLGGTSPTHTELEGKQEQEIVALQTKIGIGNSTPTTGKYLKGTGNGQSAWVTPDDVSGVSLSDAIAYSIVL